jgi:hypothetical protein
MMVNIKKILITSCVLTMVHVTVLAQSVSPSDRLPKPGDFGFGLNAVPVLKWLGNTLNGNVDNNAIEQEKFIYDEPSVLIRYAKNEHTFFRMTLLGGRNIQTNENSVWDNNQINNPQATVTDFKKTLNNFWGFGLGFEKRRANGNLQGYGGAELFYMRANKYDKFTYGNRFDITNQTPTTTVDFTNRIHQNTAQRTLEIAEGASNTFAMRAFVGAEYFFARGISFGVEFGWAMSQRFQSDGRIATESFDVIANQTQKTTRILGGQSQYNDGFDNLGGSILLNFYF